VFAAGVLRLGVRFVVRVFEVVVRRFEVDV